MSFFFSQTKLENDEKMAVQVPKNYLKVHYRSGDKLKRTSAYIEECETHAKLHNSIVANFLMPRKLPLTDFRLYWKDQFHDKIEIVSEADYKIFKSKLHGINEECKQLYVLPVVQHSNDKLKKVEKKSRKEEKQEEKKLKHQRTDLGDTQKTVSNEYEFGNPMSEFRASAQMHRTDAAIDAKLKKRMLSQAKAEPKSKDALPKKKAPKAAPKTAREHKQRKPPTGPPSALDVTSDLFTDLLTVLEWVGLALVALLQIIVNFFCSIIGCGKPAKNAGVRNTNHFGVIKQIQNEYEYKAKYKANSKPKSKEHSKPNAKTTGYEDWHILNVQSDEGKEPKIWLKNKAANTEPKKKNVDKALATMLEKGYSNENGWLARLLESVDGDIYRAIGILGVDVRDFESRKKRQENISDVDDF